VLHYPATNDTAATVFVLKYKAIMNDLGDIKSVYF
jgi:hypothetical protein